MYDFYGIKLDAAEQTLDLVHLEQKDARMLEIDTETAVFLFECTSKDIEGRVIEFARTYTRSDKCNFSVNFNRE